MYAWPTDPLPSWVSVDQCQCPGLTHGSIAARGGRDVGRGPAQTLFSTGPATPHTHLRITPGSVSAHLDVWILGSELQGSYALAAPALPLAEAT